MTNNPTIGGVSRATLESLLSETTNWPSNAWLELRTLLDAPAVERQEPKPSQVPVLRAMAANYRNGHSWDFLDGEAVSKAADEITAQASTIARLEARVAEMESGRGEMIRLLREVVETGALLFDLQQDFETLEADICACVDATAALNGPDK